MTEEQFYKEKIFNKKNLSILKKQFPDKVNSISLWYKSERYKSIQKNKSFLSNKLNLMIQEGEIIDIKKNELYQLFQWYEKTDKNCHYCKLPENLLSELQNLPGHINKRFPKRGSSLEIDRKLSYLPYNNINNLVLACYWCNNAKTDTFSEIEFLKIGNVLKTIWENRLNKKL